jgi:hypothetical protein
MYLKLVQERSSVYSTDLILHSAEGIISQVALV